MKSIYGKAKKLAFTLIEILVAIVIMAIFVYYAYQLFVGGSKTANKANWTSSIVNQLRNGTALLNKQIKQTSYPTTLLNDLLKDPTENPNLQVPQKYYLKILQNNQQILPPQSGEKLIMSFVTCQPEKPQQGLKGVLVENNLYFVYKTSPFVPVGDLVLKTKAYNFTTSPPDYAQSGNLNLQPIPNEEKTINICQDVAYVIFKVDPSATLPTLPTDFKFIQITIHCKFPKDPKTYKENSIIVTPNVGIGLL